MATLKEIAEAIQSIESKKQTLKEAFNGLQEHSHSLSSFSLSWSEIDSYFSQIQSTLQSRFDVLQQKEQSVPKSVQKKFNQKQNEKSVPKLEQNQTPVSETPLTPEIRAMFEKMEAVKVRNWVTDYFKSKSMNGDRNELIECLKSAPDPCKLVLDAIDGFHPKGKSSVMLLEALMTIDGGKISGDMRERAKSLAMEWKGEVDKVVKEDKYSLEVMGLLTMIGCFGLVEDFGKDVVFDIVYIAAKNMRTVNLCRVLGFEERIPDLVEKLVSNKWHIPAFRFVYEFKLDKYSPVQLLKSYLKDAKKVAQQLRKKGKNSPKSMAEADNKEHNALTTILKYIVDYNLASEYPPENIEKRIKQLESLKAVRKSNVPARPPNPNQPKKKVAKQLTQNRSKKPVTHANSAGIPSQQPYLQPLVLSHELPGSSVGSYAVPGYVPNAAYGLATPLVSYASNMGFAGPHLHASGSQLPSGSYNGPNPLDGYGFPPQHHPPYRP